MAIIESLTVGTEIICAVIAAIGTILSAVIAWLVSRSTASREIEKLQLTWKREDLLTEEREFSEMTASVAKFTQTLRTRDLGDAVAKVCSVRARECGSMADALDSLYAELSRQENYVRPVEINKYLEKVIEEKRKTKPGAKT